MIAGSRREGMMKRSGTPDARQISDSGKVQIGGSGMSLRRPRPARPAVTDSSKSDNKSPDAGNLTPKQ
jgi:hypothetical protein